MATIEELKEMLIEEKVSRIIDSIPNGNCPNAYYSIDFDSGCGEQELSCEECKRNFKKAVIEMVTAEVNAL